MRRKSKKVKQRPQVIIIAGPNGAGKTTFATRYIPKQFETPHFVNADLIARGISPFAPETVAVQAGKLMLRRIAELTAARDSFSIETTLSGLGYRKHIAKWRAAGYRITLIFLSLESAELAVSRVKARVSQGGQAIPEDVVIRRFNAGIANLHNVYLKLVDTWLIFDNSSRFPKQVDYGENSNKS
jgi:predicted ABC-type ATPase